MKDTSYPHQDLLQVSFVPARCAYLIRPGSSKGFDRAVAEASSRWAGVTEPILTVPKKGTVPEWSHQIIDIAGIQALVNVDADSDAAAKLAQQHTVPLVHISSIDEHRQISSFTVHPSYVSNDAGSLVLVSEESSRWQKAAVGFVTNSAHREVVESGTPNPYQLIEGLNHVLQIQFAGMSCLHRGQKFFGAHYAESASLVTPVILFVGANSLKDLQYFWNLRALSLPGLSGPSVIFIPATWAKGAISSDGLVERLHAAVAQRSTSSPDVFLTSVSLPHEYLTSLAEGLGFIPRDLGRIEYSMWAGRRTDEPPQKSTFMKRRIDVRQFLVGHREYGAVASQQILVFEAASTQVSVASPVALPGIGRGLLRLRSQAIKAVPKKTALAQNIVHAAHWRNGWLEYGVSLLQPILNFELRVPNVTESVDILLNAVTLSHNLSTDGALAHSLGQRFDTSVLLDPHVLRLIRELTTPRSKSLIKEVRKQERDWLPDEALELLSQWGGRVERRFLPLASLRQVLGADAVKVAEKLVGAKLADRGLIVDCKLCHITSFIPFRDTQSAPTCPACSAEASYRQDTNELVAAYRLSGLVDRASDQGVVQHVVALAAVSRMHRSVDLRLGVDLEWSDSARREADLFGVVDGRVVLGEVKSSGPSFTAAQIDRDVDLAKRVQADVYLMVCMEPLGAEAVAYAASTAMREGVELAVLTGPVMEYQDERYTM